MSHEDPRVAASILCSEAGAAEDAAVPGRSSNVVASYTDYTD